MRLAAVLLSLALASCAQPASHGEAAHPTIVSLNPCTDAILAEVADPAQVLAISHYSQDPRASSMPLATARRYRATAGTVEEVLALDPDIVVAGSFLPTATARAFEKLGIRVETFDIAGDVPASEAQVARLVALAGHPERGSELNRRIEAALDRGHTTGPRPTAVVWQEGGIVAGGDSLVAALLDNAGFANHAAARGLGQGAYLPLEEVLADPPDVVLAAGGERALTHPALRAVNGMDYRTLDPSLLYCGGPTIIRAAERLAEIRSTVG